jgi:hypothetical protein
MVSRGVLVGELEHKSRLVVLEVVLEKTSTQKENGTHIRVEMAAETELVAVAVALEELDKV